MKGKMKRTLITITAILLSIAIVVLFTYIGDKTRGPLEDLFSKTSSTVSDIEQNLFMDSREGRRAESLRWFTAYRKDLRKLSDPDTIFLGAFDNRTEESFESIISLEDSLQIVLPIIHIYTAWGSSRNQKFPELHVKTIIELGSLPFITWEPWLSDFDEEAHPYLPEKEKRDKNGLIAIANGDYDFYIDKWAANARDIGEVLFIRFGHEMNDPYRYPWGPQNNKAEDFIAAWQHVVDRFRALEAYNIIWVWAPHPAYGFYDAYYPGDDYVDWLGVGTLNYGTVAVWSQWWSFQDIFKGCYEQLADKNKPIIITEFGSLPIGGERDIWYEEALSTLPAQYPMVKGVIFFHSKDDNTTTYKSLDWYIKDDSLTIQGIIRAFGKWSVIDSSTIAPI